MVVIVHNKGKLCKATLDKYFSGNTKDNICDGHTL